MSTVQWCFKYEPKTFDEMILNDDIKPLLKKALTEIPNIMLIGSSGVGKGTFTNIFLRETKLDFMKLNCSDETSVDAMRTKVKGFAQSMGITPLKIAVMNESDHLSTNAQAMLRDLIESVQDITRFIFQCNYGHKMIPEIKSRCQVIEVSNPPAKKIFEFCDNILKSEKVRVDDKKIIIKIIKDLYPDIRKIVHTLQLNTVDGVLKGGYIDKSDETNRRILDKIKDKDLDAIRTILRSNPINYVEVYQYLFDNVGEFKSPGDAVLIIGEHLYRDAIIAIREINFVRMVVDMMKRGIV